MFGKHFNSMYSGSMLGAGENVFAVWGFVIANCVNSAVELNPTLIATVLGTTRERVESAIDYLCQPDPCSRNAEHEGRRLIKEGAFQYHVVSHDLYRGMRNEDDRRAYNRRKQQEYRAKKRVPPCTGVYHDVPPSAHTEAEAEADKKNPPTPQNEKLDPSMAVSGFMDRVRLANPRARIALDRLARLADTAGEDLYSWVDQMEAVWTRYQQEKGNLRITWNAGDFFGDGHYATPEAWPRKAVSAKNERQAFTAVKPGGDIQ